MRTCTRVRVTKMEGDTVTGVEVLGLDLVYDDHAFEADLPVKVGDELHILGEPVEVVRV